MRRTVLALFACSIFCRSYAQDAVPGPSTERRDTIRYGIETQVMELLSTLKTEKDKEFLEDILSAFDTTTSPKLRSSIFDYLGALELGDAEGRAAAIIARRDQEADALVGAAFTYLVGLRSGAALGDAKTILKDDEKKYVLAAIKTLGAAGSVGEAEALRQKYESDGVDQPTKEAIILALGRMKSSSSFELLVSVASSDESGKALRMYACTALGDLGDDRAVPVLTGASTAADPNVRASAIAALGKYSGSKALAAIREGLRDPHVLPRIAAAKASGELADSEAIPFLEYKASYDPERAVREASLTSLAAIGGAQVDDFLYAYFSDSKTAIAYRAAAFGAVVAKGGAAARAKALAAFAVAQAVKDRTLVTAFAKAAMAVDGPNAMPFAEALLGDNDFSMRLGGIAWADRNKARELEAVIRSLSVSDPSDAVKRRAAQALGRLGS